MFENPRRGRQAKNFTTNVPKILDLKSSSEQIFSENCGWVPLGFLFLLNKQAGQPIRTEDKGAFSILEHIQTSDKMAPVFQKRFTG